MKTESIWEGTAPASAFTVFSGEAAADVCIVGGGVTGITAAQLLADAGKTVIVLEARSLGGGTTGYSTGNLHVVPDDGLSLVLKKWNRDVAVAVARSRAEMVDHVERTVTTYGLNCAFARRPHYLFALDEKQAEQLEDERKALSVVGLPVSVATDVPLPASIGIRSAIRIEGQAQFQPAAYTRLLAERIVADSQSRCRVFEHSPALEIDSDKGVVRTAGGAVRADHVILATHIPKGFNLLHAAVGPYREYGVAARLPDVPAPDGIFWSMEEPSHSIRSFTVDGVRHLIVIGEKHKTGQHEDATDYYARVEEYARVHFGVVDFAYRWSGQHYRSPDALPYIGKTVNSGRAYVATGFGTSGLLYGPVAAQIIADEILGHENPFAALYAAKRFTPAKSAGDFLKENLNVAEQYARDWLGRGAATNIDKIDDWAPGEGRLVETDGKKVAVFVDEAGEVHTLSPVCTHMGCIVHWNGAEKSWDCPCHGSRFGCTGEVLEGPALEPLKRLSKKAD
jgi:glycine/D-amino acid oxidase-like deaminating enzyme/nitrite reductase/ring-hydroxylating ferredoxin subunit